MTTAQFVENIVEMTNRNPSPEYFKHKCKESVLRAINAAQTRGDRDFSIADLHERVVGEGIYEGSR